MKTISAAMQTHLDGETTTLSSAWKVTRVDGVIFRFTSNTKDVTADFGIGEGSQTYVASGGYNRTNIQNDSDMSVNNFDIVGVLDDASITKADLQAGLFNGATVVFFMFNHEDTSMGVIKIMSGTFGEVKINPKGSFDMEFRDISSAYLQGIGEVYSKDCRADLGDNRCRLPVKPDEIARNEGLIVGDYRRVRTLSNGDTSDFEDRRYICTVAGTTAGTQPSYDTTIGNPTVDGTATLVAEDAWIRFAEVSSVDGTALRRKFTVTELTPTGSFPDDYFNGGGCTFDTGNNAGTSMEIRDFVEGTSTQDIELFLEMPFDISIGDIIGLYPGCDKISTTCIDKFDNLDNFVGEPYVPGKDYMAQYPDAR